MSTTTTNKGLTEPAYDAANWDTPLNTNFSIIDNIAGGVTTLATTIGAHTLVLSEYQPQIIKVTGVLTGNVTYTIPISVGGQWTITNSATVGAYAVTFASGGGGTSVTLQASATTIIYSDGTNIVTAVTTSAAPNSVGNTQLAQATANTIKGNPTGGTANVQDAAVTTYLDTIDNTQGDILYRNASIWTTLPPGDAGLSLLSGGPAANPSWGSPLPDTTGQQGKVLIPGGWSRRTISAFGSLIPQGASNPTDIFSDGIVATRTMLGQWNVALVLTNTAYAPVVGNAVGVTGVPVVPVIFNQTTFGFTVNWVTPSGALDDPVANATEAISIIVTGGL